MNVRFLRPKERKEVESFLSDRFGVNKVKYLFFETGKEKVRGFSGSFTKEDILALAEIANVEIIGLYFLRLENPKRLSFDAAILLRDSFGDSIAELDESEAEKWMKGEPVETGLPSGIYVVKYKKDCFGCGYSNGEKLLNYVPKERRVRK